MTLSRFFSSFSCSMKSLRAMMAEIKWSNRSSIPEQQHRVRAWSSMHMERLTLFSRRRHFKELHSLLESPPWRTVIRGIGVGIFIEPVVLVICHLVPAACNV